MRGSLASAAVVLAALLAGAPAALAGEQNSSNWAGYAVHRSGVRFTTVSGAWRQPSAACAPGHRTYSAFWVGLGGYSLRSNSLEQIGTEVDCSASGAIRSSAWYELVPSASRTIRLRVRPGDVMAARVSVSGDRVSVALDDLTSRRSFHRTLHAGSVDAGSAEWIAEAPSECIGANQCQTLPLADFGSTSFALARARSTAGRVGSISDRAWEWTRLRLLPGGRRFVAAHQGGVPAGAAIPSALSPNGSQFSVSYLRVSIPAPRFMRARQASLSDGYLVH